MKHQNKPCKCGETSAVAFGWHAYTTGQGKRKRRRDSRCKACRRVARLVRYHEKCAARDRAVSAAWKKANTARVTEYSRAYRSTAVGKSNRAKAQAARHARLKAGKAGHEQPEILQLYEDAKALEAKMRACVECDDDLELVIHVDHRKPLARGGTHTLDNLQLLSARENLIKWAHDG